MTVQSAKPVWFSLISNVLKAAPQGSTCQLGDVLCAMRVVLSVVDLLPKTAQNAVMGNI